MPAPLPFVQVRAEFRSGLSASRLARGLFGHQTAGAVSTQALAKWAGVGLAVECWAWAQAACPSGSLETADAAELMADAVGWPGAPDALVSLLEAASVVERLPSGFRFRGWEELYGKALERREGRAEFRKAAEFLRRRGYRNSGMGDNSMTSPTGAHVPALEIIQAAESLRAEAPKAATKPRANARQTAGNSPPLRPDAEPVHQDPGNAPGASQTPSVATSPNPPALSVVPTQAPMFSDTAPAKAPPPKRARPAKAAKVAKSAPEAPTLSRQQQVYEAMEARRKERCEEEGVAYTHSNLPPQQVNARLKAWVALEKGSPEHERHRDAWALYLEDKRHAAKAWPVGLFLSEGVLRDYLAKADAEARAIAALPTIQRA